MSYTIDVYRGDARCQKNIVTFGTFVTLFPQLPRRFRRGSLEYRLRSKQGVKLRHNLVPDERRGRTG